MYKLCILTVKEMLPVNSMFKAYIPCSRRTSNQRFICTFLQFGILYSTVQIETRRCYKRLRSQINVTRQTARIKWILLHSWYTNLLPTYVLIQGVCVCDISPVFHSLISVWPTRSVTMHRWKQPHSWAQWVTRVQTVHSNLAEFHALAPRIDSWKFLYNHY
jgi:hypothetical protein